MENILMFFLLIMLVPFFILSIFMPFWTRKTESFGVTIPEEVFHHPKLQTMRNKYARYTTILSIIGIAAFMLLGLTATTEEATSIYFAVIVVSFLIINFIIYLKFHKEMKTFKEQENWAKEKTQHVFVDIRFRQNKLTYSYGWFIIPILVTVGLIIITFQNYQRIPELIPMQYNFEGEVTNWATKSYRSVLILPIMTIYQNLLFIFINIIIAQAKQQINPDNPEESIRKNVIFRRRWSAFSIVSSFALTLLFSVIQLSFIYSTNERIITIVSLVVTAFILLAALFLAVTTGQGGSRVKGVNSTTDTTINRDDDRYWKLGQFYFNKNDPSLFLEKRFGVGWTINCARPLVWIILIAIIGLFIGIPQFLGM
ncbi:DUF1648 domain-containing protein [Oceanobacillus bengalensis]|uniref:DUF1648 domain-containing protein n=1 Tax=Oceanobacillus bengalensis TaxID=1435466 RepID=A0A494YVY2_9BACI|nr:DUF5808 domain-containing protein [Oceanobacillus bengalensis]RKQ14366.1 DUF1648 domain-containing protein [Oceanobacillus bengalensis]